MEFGGRQDGLTLARREQDVRGLLSGFDDPDQRSAQISKHQLSPGLPPPESLQFCKGVTFSLDAGFKDATTSDPGKHIDQTQYALGDAHLSSGASHGHEFGDTSGEVHAMATDDSEYNSSRIENLLRRCLVNAKLVAISININIAESSVYQRVSTTSHRQSEISMHSVQFASWLETPIARTSGFDAEEKFGEGAIAERHENIFTQPCSLVPQEELAKRDSMSRLVDIGSMYEAGPLAKSSNPTEERGKKASDMDVQSPRQSLENISAELDPWADRIFAAVEDLRLELKRHEMDVILGMIVQGSECGNSGAPGQGIGD
ncbi:hypothetical protein BV25DRAFT_1839239 [Artomyces pyxidatus]|uniref:Uncharacterized protein n=1 Tax=Artomyces pyxidatus TaxID=48021 RepID=A0ACB8SXN3_9AGAM|nr:hypothetical protein BV25DRAFT_1839239 [Artomyces pyxidatus]